MEGKGGGLGQEGQNRWAPRTRRARTMGANRECAPAVGCVHRVAQAALRARRLPGRPMRASPGLGGECGATHQQCLAMLCLCDAIVILGPEWHRQKAQKRKSERLAFFDRNDSPSKVLAPVLFSERQPSYSPSPLGRIGCRRNAFRARGPPNKAIAAVGDRTPSSGIRLLEFGR